MSESASFTLEFKDKVSAPAKRAAGELEHVRASLHGIQSAAPRSGDAVGSFARNVGLAGRSASRDQIRLGEQIAGRQVKLQRETSRSLIAGERRHASEVLGLHAATARDSTAGRLEQQAQLRSFATQTRTQRMASRNRISMARSEAKTIGAIQQDMGSISGGGAGAASLMASGLMAVAAAAAVAAGAVAFVGAKFAASAMQAAEFAQSSTAAIAMLGKMDVGQAGKEFDEIRKSAERWGLPVQETVSSFQSLLRSGFDVGKSKELLAMGADLQTANLTAQQIQSTFLAISQIKSTGVLQGDELRQLQEAGLNMADFWGELEKRTGKTTAELKKMKEAGKLSADDAIAGIQAASLKMVGKTRHGEAAEERAGTQIAGIRGRLAAMWENFTTDIGKAIAPAETQIAKLLAPSFEKMLKNPALQRAGQLLLTRFEAFAGWLTANWPQIESTVTKGVELIAGVIEKLVAAGDFIGWGNIAKAILVTLGTLAGSAAAALGLVAGAIAGGLALAGAITMAWHTVLKTLGSVLGMMFGFGVATVMGIVEGVQSAAAALVAAVTGVVGSAIDAAKSLLGISSPSKLFADFGAMTVQGYVAGVDQNASTAAKATTELAGEAARGIEPVTRAGELMAGVPFIGPAGVAANDGVQVEAPSPVSGVRVLEPVTDYQAAASGGGRSVSFNMPFNVTLSGTATDEDGARFVEAARPKIRQVVLDVLEEAGSS